MVSVIIPHRHNRMALWTSVASVREALNGRPHEIIVSANGCEKPEYPGVKIVWNAAGLGPPKAREVGAKEATGDWLWFVDDGAIVPNNILYYMPHGDCIFYPSSTGGLTTYTGFHYEKTSRALENLVDYPIENTPKDTIPYPCFAGAHGCFLMRRDKWNIMEGYGGIFDGYGGEEVYFGLRLEHFNMKAVFDPRYTVLTYPEASDWKNRDEEFMERHKKALREIERLRCVSLDSQQANG